MYTILKGYKYRIYPNKKQEELIQKTFGSCRFVYNNCLELKINMFEQNNINMSKFDLNKYCNSVLKNKYVWLKDVDKWALSNSIFNLNSAYENFFKNNSKYPKFKSKHCNYKTYKTNFSNNNIEVSYVRNMIKLPKLKWVKAKIHREFNGKIKSATISQVPSGKYFVSILVETEHVPIESTDCMIGIDLGIKYLVVTSNGDKFNNLYINNKYKQKLSKEQRKLSNKLNGSKNWNKQRVKVAKIYEKIHNTRIDNLHKISHKLISENQVIVSEDLAISSMLKNHDFAKLIDDCGWYELTRQIMYKSNWNNRQYIKIGRFTKSSQRCNVCGYINTETVDLHIRKWICPKCREVHDRDINASINVLNEGLMLINNTF